jgi:cell division transport system permease protein
MTADVDLQARRVLPDGRFSGPMPWVIAIMMVFAVLAAAAGLSIGRAVSTMETALAGKVTVQIVDANPDTRARARAALVVELRRMANVRAVEEIGEGELRDLLAPWLGDAGLSADLPVPALIDVTLNDASQAAVDDLTRTAQGIAPGARIDRHGDWMGPLGGLLAALRWLSLALVVLTAIAAAAVVVLGARAAMDQHRATIDVMHLMGATDRQISRLFEHRVAQDAISGAALGFVVALGLVVLVGWRIDAMGAALMAGGTLGLLDALLLVLIPLGGIGLAILAARLTVLRGLARML